MVRRTLFLTKMLLASLLACAAMAVDATAQSAPAPTDSTSQPATPPATQQTKVVPYRYQTHLPESATQYYALMWGVDTFTVRAVESGELIKFSYRVVDPGKAGVLNEKKNEPSLICPRAGVKLVIPSMEKVGKLRQTGTPKEGKVYWMAFSNKGRLVKPGDHVNLVIGEFHAEGLVVQ